MSLDDILKLSVSDWHPWRAPHDKAITRPGKVTLAPFQFEVLSLTVMPVEHYVGERGSGPGWHVVLVVNVPHRDDGSLSRLTFRQDFLVYDAPTEHEAARRLLLQALMHEVDECLLVDGERINDPHRNEFTLTVKA